MKFAFDLDGTLTKYPNELGVIMRSLQRDGHEVIIITVGSSNPTDGKDYRIKWAESLGISGFELYYLPCGETKGDLLKELNVNCLIDDSENILIDARIKNPTICLLKV